jgi:hypothetical protein
MKVSYLSLQTAVDTLQGAVKAGAMETDCNKLCQAKQDNRWIYTRTTPFYLIIIIIIIMHYNSGRVSAFSTMTFHLGRSWTCSVHLTIYIRLMSFLISSSHRDLGLPAGLPVRGYAFLLIWLISTKSKRKVEENIDTIPGVSIKPHISIKTLSAASLEHGNGPFASVNRTSVTSWRASSFSKRTCSIQVIC